MTWGWQRQCALMAGCSLMVVCVAAAAWKAPESASKQKNPVAADIGSLKLGKQLYTSECLDCHGKLGAGDGPGSRDLDPRPPDLRRKMVQQQTDGELHWKITRGRGDMPGYRKMLDDLQRWHLVNYIRSLAPPEMAENRAKGEKP